MRLGVSAAVMGTGVVSGDVEVEDGRIRAVGLPGSSGPLIAIPGFVDIHVHGYAGTDFVNASPEDHVAIARSITATGVTAYQPTLMSLNVDRLVEATATHPGLVTGGARTLGFHLEGPFLSPSKPGAHDPDHLVRPLPELVDQLLETDNIQQITLAPELPGAVEAVSRLVGAGVTVSLGHSVATATETRAAINSGASVFTHVYNAMAPFTHREPGILGAALSSTQCYLTGVFDGVHLSEEAERVLIRCAQDRLVAITDGTSAVNATNNDLTLGDTPVQIRGGAPRLPDGTIAGSILTMDAAFRRLVSLGLDLPAAVRATATSPSGLSGLGEGLAVGGHADLVVLNDRYEVRQTFVNGNEVFHA